MNKDIIENVFSGFLKDEQLLDSINEYLNLISNNKEKSNEELEKILISNSGNLVENTRYNNKINNLTRVQTSMYNQIMIGVVNK